MGPSLRWAFFWEIILKPLTLLALFLIMLLQNCAHPTHPGNVSSETNAKKIIHEVVEKNDYTIDRGLKEYIEYFGDTFAKDLEQLKPSDHWIDGGAGNANAQKNFLRNLQKEKKSIPNLSAITVKYPESEARTLLDGKFKVFADRYFEDIPLSELAPADIITDVVGIINYTEALDVSLDKYLKLLKPNGKIYVFIPDSITKIKKLDGKIMNLFDWINSIPGLKAKPLTPTHSPSPIIFSFVIEKTALDILVPKLKLHAAAHRVMVMRNFEEI